MHLTPKNFLFAKMKLLVIRSISAKKFLHLVEALIFYAVSKSRLNCYGTAFRESGAGDADDVYLGTKHDSASVSSLYLLEKMENKTNRSNIFWD